MPVKSRDDRVGKRELAALAGLKEGATREQLQDTLNRLRRVLQRVDDRQLESDDWSFIRALVWNQVVRAEGRQARVIAKIVAAAGDTNGCDAAASSDAGESAGNSFPAESGTSETSSSSSSEANARSCETPETSTRGNGKTDQGDSKASKGHGRNGASAYRQAQDFFHAMAPDVIGCLCEAGRVGKMSRYREKIVIRIIGQPLFGAEGHHCEQARCRNCGHIVRAQGPDDIGQDLGTDYVRYYWSACAMLLVMHFFGGAPFKRLESLHEGWGVPMPDSNQGTVVSDADNLLLPLYRALEQHAIQKSTNFRSDDAGGMVITLKKQIDAEIAALRALGKLTKDVRTGINATGLYWETPDGPVILFYTGLRHAGEIVDRLLRHRLHSSQVAAGMRRSATRQGLCQRKAVDSCARYLKKRRNDLRYGVALAAGFPIASGAIQGACRHLVRDRLDCCGARWNVDGFEAILKLRALHCSGDLGDYWDFHLRHELEHNHSALYANATIPNPIPTTRLRRVK